MRQVGTGPDIWRRASQSPAPRPVLKTTATLRPPLAPSPPPAHSASDRAAACSCWPCAHLGARRPRCSPDCRQARTRRPPALAEIERIVDLAGFGLTQVSVTGHRFTPDSDIFDAIDLAGTPMLSFDSRAAQDRIERLSWVERASIERVFPDRLEVHITERTPFAVWQPRRPPFPHRQVRPRARGRGPQDALRRCRDLPAKAQPTEAARLFALLAGSQSSCARVEVAERIGERRWTLKLTDGGTIAAAGRQARARRLARAAAHRRCRRARGGEIDLGCRDARWCGAAAPQDASLRPEARILTEGLKALEVDVAASRSGPAGRRCLRLLDIGTSKTVCVIVACRRCGPSSLRQVRVAGHRRLSLRAA